MKKLFIILLCLFTLSCDASSLGKDTLQSVSNNLSYGRDSRTGLCYAGAIYADKILFTNVPCSEEVRFLISGKLE